MRPTLFFERTRQSQPEKAAKARGWLERYYRLPAGAFNHESDERAIEQCNDTRFLDRATKGLAVLAFASAAAIAAVVASPAMEDSPRLPPALKPAVSYLNSPVDPARPQGPNNGFYLYAFYFNPMFMVSAMAGFVLGLHMRDDRAYTRRSHASRQQPKMA